MNTYFSISYKPSNLTAKIGKPEKWKFGRIGFWCWTKCCYCDKDLKRTFVWQTKKQTLSNSIKAREERTFIVWKETEERNDVTLFVWEEDVAINQLDLKLCRIELRWWNIFHDTRKHETLKVGRHDHWLLYGSE